MATDSIILAWNIPWTEEPGGYNPWGCKESDTTEWAHTRCSNTKYQSSQVKSTLSLVF